MGENPVVANPNSKQVRASLSKLEFLAILDIFPTETAEYAHLLLPAAAFAEKSGSKTATDRRVQWSFKAVEPPGEARPDWWIIRETAKRLGFDFPYGNPEEILGEISKAAPSYGGITPERVQATLGGLQWPCPHAEHPGTPILHGTQFPKPDGRGVITPIDWQPPPEPTDEAYPLLLTTGRVSLHYNSGAMTRRSKALMEREPECFVELHPKDAGRLEIQEGRVARVITRRGDVTVKARITDAVTPGVVFMPFHFPETNVLTLDALDPTAKIPEFKTAACRVEKAE